MSDKLEDIRYTSNHAGADVLGMDDNEFKGATIQRVYQYLRRHAGGYNLDTFSYQGGSVEGKVQDCLKIILR